MKRHDASLDPRERTRLLAEAQNLVIDRHDVISIWQEALALGVGPRLANQTEDIEGTIPRSDLDVPSESTQRKGAQGVKR